MDTIDTVMNDMAEAMTTTNASARQVSGIARWRGMVDAAVAAGYAAGGSCPALMQADAVGSDRHVLWLATAGAVIRTMLAQAAEAREMAEDARERAAEARQAARQAEADGAQATADGNEDTAAACADTAAAAASEAELAEDEADACDAWAAAAADAAACGRRLTASEDAVHRPVMDAYAHAGGHWWIAADKDFLGVE